MQAMAHTDHSTIIFDHLECLILVQLSPEGFLVLAAPLPLNPWETGKTNFYNCSDHMDGTQNSAVWI